MALHTERFNSANDRAVSLGLDGIDSEIKELRKKKLSEKDVMNRLKRLIDARQRIMDNS